MKTTDNQEEIFDLVDENDRVIGQTTRGEVHKNKNLIHRSVGVAVFNKRGELFLQQRSETKDMDPLLWDISCGGHVKAENLINTNKPIIQSSNKQINKYSNNPMTIYEETAHRELLEELGVDLPLKFVDKYICQTPEETEMVMLFKSYHNGPFKLNKKEIITGRFFSKKDLKKALKTGKIKIGDFATENLRRLGWIE